MTTFTLNRTIFDSPRNTFRINIDAMKKLVILLLAAGTAMNCCAENNVQQKNQRDVFISSQIIPPGKDGESLPPQDKTIAQHWPVEFREFIERVEKFFSTSWPRYFTEQDIEQALHVKLVPAPERVSSGSGVVEEYWIVGVPFVRPHIKGVISPTETYTVMKPDKYPGTGEFQIVMMHLPIETSKFCINPYDFLIYSGAKARVPTPIHPPTNYVSTGYRYEWGMLKTARGFSLSVPNLIEANYNMGTEGQCISSLMILATRDIGLKK